MSDGIISILKNRSGKEIKKIEGGDRPPLPAGKESTLSIPSKSMETPPPEISAGEAEKIRARLQKKKKK